MIIPSLKASINAVSGDFRGVHDLNFDLFICHTFGLIRPGTNYEQWKDSFCSSYGVVFHASSAIRIFWIAISLLKGGNGAFSSLKTHYPKK